MGRNSQPRLGFNPLFAEVNVLLRTGVYNLDVDALVEPGPDVSCDDDEGVGVCGVPDAFLRWVPEGLEGEFDGVGWW